MTQIPYLRWVVCLLSVALASCGELRPYSETRDKQGQAIAASTADAYQTLKSSFDISRKNDETLLTQEQAAIDEVEAARRDAIITVLVWGTVGAQLSTPVAAQLNKLAGPRAAEYFDSLTDIEQADKQLATIDDGLHLLNVKLPDCKQLMSPGGDASLPTAIAAQAKAACTARGSAQAAATGFMAQATPPNPPIAISTTITQIAAEQMELDAERAEEETLREKFSATQEEYNKAVASIETGSGDKEQLRSRARELGRQLRDLATQLEAADDVFSRQFISNERRKSLDKFFEVVADLSPEEPIPQGTSRAAMALVLFPNTLDKAKEDLTDAQKLPLAGLVLRKKYEETQYNAATSDINLRKGKIDLLRAKQKLQESQAKQLLVAQDGLSTLSSGFEKRSMLQVLGEAPSKPASGQQDMNERVFEAAGRYIYARTRAQAAVDKLDSQIHAVEFKRQIAYSEANAEQWSLLISSNAGQLSTYGASGIKPEMLLSLFNSLTLLWIAIGVN